MASRSVNQPAPAALDVREIWFSNMYLLGFQADFYEEKYSIKFTKDMFAHINKNGCELVCHFLFSKLDSRLAYEKFR